MSVLNIWAGAVTHESFWVRGKVQASRVRLAVSTNRNMSDSIWFGAVRPTEYGIASIRATGLQPDTQYYYAFETDDKVDTRLRGRAHTFGTPGEPYNFTFWFASCAGQSSPKRHSNHEVFNSIRSHNPLFGIHMGDMHYWDIGSNRHGYTGPPWDDVFRNAYDIAILGQRRQQDLYRNVPLAYVWDDHDYGPNNSGKHSPSRDEACLVYRERVPHYPLPTGPGAHPIYQTFVCGRVRFILTDGRAERDPKRDVDDHNKKVFGEEQEEWLFDLFESVAEPLIIWVQTYPWIAEVDEGGDHWGAYTTERQVIADRIAESGVADRLVMLSGDMHSLAADTGANNQWGGFPVMHAAAMDASPSVKGGPYTYGPLNKRHQFGLCKVDDRGGNSPITITFSGRRWFE